MSQVAKLLLPKISKSAFTSLPKQMGPYKKQLRLLSSQDVNFLPISGERKIAYKKLEASDPSKPTLVFVPGFMSTMDGFKATMLDNFCKSQGLGYVRFDFEGMGKSPGSFETIYFGHWLEDARQVLHKLVPNKALLVGSSMGGWMSLKLATENPEKIAALVLIAPAINFVKQFYDMFYKLVDEEQRAILDSGKLLTLKKNYGNIFLRKSFSEESVLHHIDLDEPLNIKAPVRIIHGVQDPDVPYKQSLKIMSALTSLDVDVTFRKEGQHQMSEPSDLELLENTVLDLVGLLSRNSKL